MTKVELIKEIIQLYMPKERLEVVFREMIGRQVPEQVREIVMARFDNERLQRLITKLQDASMDDYAQMSDDHLLQLRDFLMTDAGASYRRLFINVMRQYPERTQMFMQELCAE